MEPPSIFIIERCFRKVKTKMIGYIWVILSFSSENLIFLLTFHALFSTILIGTFYIPFMSRGTAYETKKFGKGKDNYEKYLHAKKRRSIS